VTLEGYYANLKRLDTAVFLRAGLRAVPKGRPRFAGNHAYTPEKTRTFEAQIAHLAREVMGHRLPYSCPVKVTLKLVEEVPTSWSARKKELALAGLLVPLRGDLDNREKAVFDALNGIVFHDDVQIGHKVSSKEFGFSNLITVTIERNGLSDIEIDRWIKTQKVKDGSVANRGSAKLG
jgi:Holliday junction resolvase RusA-like endonuclease